MHIHTWSPSSIPEYVVCPCGTYHQPNAPAPETLYTPDYWSHKTGHSTIHEQIHNVDAIKVNGVTKSELVLRHVKPGHAALEIACAPGVIMYHLSKIFNKVTGIETHDFDMEEDDVLIGWFPEVTQTLPDASYDLIVALDVLEHVFDGEAFVNEARRLLTDDGRFLVMIPISNDSPEKMYLPEHVWVYSREFMLEWLQTKFRKVTVDVWQPGHTLFVCQC